MTTAPQWDADRDVIGTPEGVVDLKTGQLRKGRPSDLISKQTAIGPAEDEDCPTWKAFLSDVMQGGEGIDRSLESVDALVAYVKRLGGYCLTGDTSEQMLSFFHGDGGRGKGTILHTLQYIMGDYAAEATIDVFMASKNGDHPIAIAGLAGARLVTVAETKRDLAWSEPRVKALTGGDSIRTRFMNRDFFEFIPQFKIVISGQHEPALETVDDSMKRRLQILRFLCPPARLDRTLGEKLKREAPGIFRWLINGCLEWRRQGLNPPEAVTSATADYFEEQDLLRYWLDEECDIEPGNWSKTATRTELFASWCAYSKRNGEDPGKAKSFGMLIVKHGPERHRIGKARLYRGIRLKPKEIPYSE